MCCCVFIILLFSTVSISVFCFVFYLTFKACLAAIGHWSFSACAFCMQKGEITLSISFCDTIIISYIYFLWLQHFLKPFFFDAFFLRNTTDMLMNNYIHKDTSHVSTASCFVCNNYNQHIFSVTYKTQILDQRGEYLFQNNSDMSCTVLCPMFKFILWIIK